MSVALLVTEQMQQTFSRHDFLQSVALYKQLFIALEALCVILLLLVDDCTANGGDALPCSS
jgi:hypothetical protein